MCGEHEGVLVPTFFLEQCLVRLFNTNALTAINHA